MDGDREAVRHAGQSRRFQDGVVRSGSADEREHLGPGESYIGAQGGAQDGIEPIELVRDEILDPFARIIVDVDDAVPPRGEIGVVDQRVIAKAERAADIVHQLAQLPLGPDAARAGNEGLDERQAGLWEITERRFEHGINSPVMRGAEPRPACFSGTTSVASGADCSGGRSVASADTPDA
jgi:hypothetical protein